MSQPMVLCDNLVKIYKTIDLEVIALQGLDLTVGSGEMMGIIGNSGSGKSTLLNMLGGLDKPSAGRLEVDGRNLSKMSESEIVDYKRHTVGFVWQNNARNLIPYLTAIENIETPMLLAQGQGLERFAKFLPKKKLVGEEEEAKPAEPRLSASAIRIRARELLEMVNLSHRAHNKLGQLSGGEQQRVAIALALANNPRVLLADEPTGAVDTKTAALIMDVIRDINKQTGLTVIIVTHDRALSAKVDRVVSIRDGRTSSEFIRTKTYAQEMREIESGERNFDQDDIHQEEYVVVDAVGRLQLPKEGMEHLHLSGKSRVRVTYEPGRVVLSQENPEIIVE